MNFINHQLSISPLRCTAAVIGVAAVWLLMPEIVQAAVTFGEIGENVAENAKGVAKGVDLPVDVRFGHHVQIDQGDPPNCRARQCFRCPRADTTDTDHADMGVLETV